MVCAVLNNANKLIKTNVTLVLFYSGSTGKPKGILHTTAGYMVYAYTTFKYVFDYREHDIYFCTADIGWITGHTYVAYGPLLNAATSVMVITLYNFNTLKKTFKDYTCYN